MLAEERAALPGCRESLGPSPARLHRCAPAAPLPPQGGRFAMFGGSVQGTYRELEQDARLVLDWRFRCARPPLLAA